MSNPEKPSEPKEEEQKAEQALSDEDLEHVTGGTAASDYYVKKHIGNVKYNEFKLDVVPTKE